MGLMGKMDAWAMKKMMKEDFLKSWKTGFGCEGAPPPDAVAAIKRVAEVASENVRPYDLELAVTRLLEPMQWFARSLNMNALQIAVGSGVMMALFSQYSGYEWAANCVFNWEVNSLYKYL